MMLSQTRLLSALAFMGCFLAPMLAAAVPLQLAHHGTLYNTAGEPVTGSVEITFSLWDDEDTGAQVWSEVRTVDVVDGVYSTLLGSESAVDAVLKAEPALWLQLEIAEEALLPRHPVASAPYAIVAETAINVDGGTVNATSVSVGGTEVINATGSWTGGAGSVDWSALTGAPADADTLAGLGLSCADGDRAVWNDTSQLWECGSANVTLDRIDTASAADGDILTVTGGLTVWQPGATLAGCTLNLSSEGVAELTCSGVTTRLARATEYIAGAGGTRLRADGTLRGPGAPGGTFSSVWGGGSLEFNCALDLAGLASCWDSVGTPIAVPAAALEKIACWRATCCAVTQSAAVTCFGTEPQHPVLGAAPPGSAFVDVALDANAACGVTTAGTVECWGNALASSYEAAAPTGGGYSSITEVVGEFYIAGASGISKFNSNQLLWTITPPTPVDALVENRVLLSSGEVYAVTDSSLTLLSEQVFSYLDPGTGAYGITPDGRYLPVQVPGATAPD